MREKTKLLIKLVNILLSCFIISTTLNYTEYSLGTNLVKTIIGFLIILVTIGTINFKRYKWITWLIGVEFILPLCLMLFGVYNYNMAQSFKYLFFFSFYLLLVICLSSVYKDKIDIFLFIWQISLSLVLFFLFLVYRGLSFNLMYLLTATLSGQRYGQFLLTQRYGMGFSNVNTLALFSTLLMFCSFYFLYKGKNKLFSLINILCSTIFVLNAESRTPIVLMIVLFTSVVVCRIRNDNIRFITQTIVLILEILFSVLFSNLFIAGNTTSLLYQKINEISSYRLSFGTSAMGILKGSGSLLLGIGPLNSTYITEDIFGRLLTLDNSLEYFVFTLGIIGTILVYIYLFYLFFCINRSRSKLGFVSTTFYFAYSIFENIIFLPNSPVSVLILTIIFILMRNYTEQQQ